MRFDYEPRRIIPLPVREVGGWRLKVTQVLAAGRTGDEGLVEAAMGAAADFLPAPPVTSRHYGVGIAVVHEGTRYDFVLVGHWAYETELSYQTFMRASSDSTRLEPLTAGELATDVWDLKVLAFERDARLEHVLVAGRGGDEGGAEPGLERYLEARLGATL